VRRLATWAARAWYELLLTALVVWVVIDAEGGKISVWQGCFAAGAAGILAGEAIVRGNELRRKQKLMDIQTRTLTSNYRTITLQEEMLKDQGWVGP
jgi:hypothetical protein